MSDSEKADPAVVLPYLLGRKLRAEEVYEAFGLKKSTYYDLQSKGALTTADRLISVAKHFNINPVELLLQFNQLDMRDVVEAATRAVDAAEEVAEMGKSLPTRERRKIGLRPRFDRPAWPGGI